MKSRAAEIRKGSARKVRRLVGATVLISALFAVLALPVIGVFSASVAANVPGIRTVLAAASPWLPARVAWQHDPGSDQLLSGVYFGWTDGQSGQLYLLGKGCTGGTASLTLAGTTTLELSSESVLPETVALTGSGPTPVLRLLIGLPETASFDRAVLRCRSGAEYRTRLAATVQLVEGYLGQNNLNHIATTEPHAAEPEAMDTAGASNEHAPLLVSTPASFPSVGFVAELRLVAGNKPITLLGVDYAPPAAATGQVLAAAGHRAALPWWRRQAKLLASAQVSDAHYQQTLALTEPEALTPWHLGYSSLVGPRALAHRSAGNLNLHLDDAETLFLAVTPGSFAATAEPRPVLTQLLLNVQQDGRTVTLIPDGLTFGWTARPQRARP